MHDASLCSPPAESVDLQNLGAMRLPRLWAALHDALIYNDPVRAKGGKVGVCFNAGMHAAYVREYRYAGVCYGVLLCVRDY